jgi:hypothetical protein
MTLRTILMAAALLVGSREGFAATAAQGAMFAGPVLSDVELDQIHAGFSDSLGQSVSLGAVMKSYVDGSLVLQSTMTVNASGITSTQLLGDNARPLDAAELANLPTLAQAGAVIDGAGGMTSFVHSLSGQGLTNMVVNTANGRNIVQSTAVTVAVPNLQTLEQQAMLAGFATQLHDMLGSGLLNASSH